MYQSGELQKLLGIEGEAPAPAAPTTAEPAPLTSDAAPLTIDNLL